MLKRLKQLKQLPCVGCGNNQVDIAHANWGEFGKGMGIKADDEYTIPLCRSCHKWLDTYQGLNRARAKEWFLIRLDLVNRALDEQQSCF